MDPEMASFKGSIPKTEKYLTEYDNDMKPITPNLSANYNESLHDDNSKYSQRTPVIGIYNFRELRVRQIENRIRR